MVGTMEEVVAGLWVDTVEQVEKMVPEAAVSQVVG
jgi:hypothetical protein